MDALSESAPEAGAPKDMSRDELEAAVIFLMELNRKPVERPFRGDYHDGERD